MDTAVRATSWRWWQQYCTDCGTDPWLRDTNPALRSQLLLGFAARARTGYFGKGRQVGAQTVEEALRHVAQAFVLEGYTDPRRAGASADLAVALPVHAIALAATACHDPNALPRETATAHLIVMAFYFLLRVGEYTLPLEHRTTRTVQFRICDIRFWQGQTLLPPNSDAAILAAASSVTLIVDNQKRATWRHYPPGSGARQFLPSALYSRARECHYGARHAINDAFEFCTTGDSSTTQPYSL